MFKAIVSKLSLSPSAASELAFYARRLRRERVTRTFSAIAAVLVVALQFATIIAPPVASNAASPGDLIYGGFVSKDDLLNQYDAHKDLRDIYAYWGVTRTNIVDAKETTVNSKDHTLNSLSRVPHEAGEGTVTVDGTEYYYRPLYHADTGSFVQSGSDYKVLAGTSSTGKYFALMFLCGNIIFRPQKPSPTPVPFTLAPIPSARPLTPIPTPTPKPATPVKTATPKPATPVPATPTPVKTATPVPATPIKTPTPTPTPKLALICTKLTGSVSSGQSPLTVNFTGSGTATGQTITNYIFNFGDNTTPETLTTPTTSHLYSQVGTFTATLAVKGSTGAVSAATPACSYTITVSGLPAAYAKHKSAWNLTQNIDATTKDAQAGDQIRYTLTTENTGGTAGDYVVVEHVEDIVEYADITDTGGAVIVKSGDGSVQNEVLNWPSVTIAPGQTITNTFTVTVKNPIPDTPVGLSDKYSYDLRMDNIYGNQVQIHIQPPLPKQIELASTELPQTGAATSTTIILLAAVFAFFFYLRNRQLAREIRLLRHDFQTGAS